MTKIQRVKKVIKWLIFSDFGENETEIARLLGYTKSSLSQILNEKVPISDKFIDKLCLVDKNINKVWVLEGKENMLIKPSEKENISYRVEFDRLFSDLIKSRDELIDQFKDNNNILKKYIKTLEEKIDNLQEENNQLKKAKESSISGYRVAEDSPKLSK